MIAMPDSVLPLRLPVHPHQLEVQEFDSHDLIVDLRDAERYADDHLPGAVSVPWSASSLPTAAENVESAPSGAPATPTVDAVPVALPAALESHLAALAPGASVLVYCDRGGLDSALVVGALKQRGHTAELLPGGWPSYRRWVTASIEVLARAMSFRWVRCPPAGGMPPVLAALEAHGHQVLPLIALLSQQTFPGISLPGDAPPSQAAFETRLVDTLRRLDPGRPVWVCEPLWLDGRVGMPVPFHDALKQSQVLRIEASLTDRVCALLGHLQVQANGSKASVEALIQSLQQVMPADPGVRLGASLSLATQGHAEEALARLLSDAIDPLYQALSAPRTSERETSLTLASLSDEAAWSGLLTLPEPWQQALRSNPDQISP